MVIARTIVLMVALLNQVLVMFGVNPLPFSDEEVYAGVTTILTVGATIWAWWKNNSFTKSARNADEYLKTLKEIERDGQ
jgi:SPP1 family holin